MDKQDSTSTVRIVRYHRNGGPEVLQFDELPLPEPGRREVRIRVKAIGINRSEVMSRKGVWLSGGEGGGTPSVQTTLPSKLGYEAAGIVEAVGTDVDTSWIGKTVSTVPPFDGSIHGVYGEVAIVPARVIASYPDQLSYAEGATIWMQYLTAYGALIQHGHLTKDDVVLITAGSSSVGIAAIEIAKAEGAISVATTRTSQKKAELFALGAHHVIATEEEDLVSRVNEITGNKGARIVFDAVGGRQLEALATVTAVNGIIYEYGSLSGEPTLFPALIAMGKALTVKGYTVFEVTGNRALAETGKQYVFDHIVAGDFKPRIDKVFPFEDIAEAHRYMEANGQIGKIVVTV